MPSRATRYSDPAWIRPKRLPPLSPPGCANTVAAFADHLRPCTRAAHHRSMDRIWPNGKTTKVDLTQRLDRAENILRAHADPPRQLRYHCANHIADALGSVAKCLLESADRALDAAEQEAAETQPEWVKRPRTYTLKDLERIIRDQRASLPAGPGHPKDGWPS